MSGELSRIVSDPNVVRGKAVIRGTRIPVDLLVRMVAQRIPEVDILREYPRLQPEDIQAALYYAASVVSSDVATDTQIRIRRPLT